MAREIFAEFATDEELERKGKIGSVALVLLALDIAPTEAEWRDYLLMAGINFYEASGMEDCIDATNLFYYSNLLPLTLLEDDTWLYASHPQAFNGVTDEEYAETIEQLRLSAAQLKEQFQEA